MKHELRKYFWALNLLTLTVCAYFAAQAIAAMIASSMPQPSGRRAGLGSAWRPPLGAQASRDVSVIQDKNIFCASCQPQEPAPSDPAAGGQGESSSGDPVKTSLNLKLIATLVSEDDKAFSYAAIHFSEENKTRLVPIGAKVLGEATLEEILVRQVHLRNSGRLEYLELDRGSSPSPSPTPPPVAATPSRRRKNPYAKDIAELSKGVRSLGGNKWEIQRRTLNKVLGNTAMLASQARIVPSSRNGKPNGFKLYAIRPGSIYQLIGMSNGDTIHAINGARIDTPDKALEVYTKVRNASHLTISFSRRGQPKTHEYVIR